jgi:hypothetical protein
VCGERVSFASLRGRMICLDELRRGECFVEAQGQRVVARAEDDDLPDAAGVGIGERGARGLFEVEFAERVVELNAGDRQTLKRGDEGAHAFVAERALRPTREVRARRDKRRAEFGGTRGDETPGRRVCGDEKRAGRDEISCRARVVGFHLPSTGKYTCVACGVL